jgi:serine phosphatase RsbU (regulator of sigma subunit)/HAMP domain-containing protein
MKFRFTIGRRIGIGFGALIMLTLVAFLATSITLKNGREKTNQVTGIYTPSISLLKELHLKVVTAKMLITNWVYIQSADDVPGKSDLRKLLKTDYPKIKKDIKHYEEQWTDDQNKKTVDSLLVQIDSLFYTDKMIMQQINSFASYDDASVHFLMTPLVDEDGPITLQSNSIIHKLQDVIDEEQAQANTVTTQMLDNFSVLNSIVRFLGIALLIGGVIIAFFTVRSIVRPVRQLRDMLLTMARGVLPTLITKETGDEIGEMSSAMNNMVGGLKRTTEFANEIGKGNFTSIYQPLSDEDTLGQALLKMRTELHENEQILERKVIERTEEVVRQKQEIEVKSRELEILYKHVTDSIRYAKRIQESILPPESLIRRLLPDSFVFFKPKDIVSGDFYWVSEKDNKVLFSAIDCTGHGVPGAFMSLVGYNLIKEITDNMAQLQPAKILDGLSEGVRNTLHQFDNKSSAKDGMDIAFCVLDYKKMELQYSGAMNSLYLIRNKNIQEIKADKVFIGYSYSEEQKTYTNHTVKLQKGDCIYISSDGFADQFGGPKGKKFMLSNFRQLLLDVHQKPLDIQRNILEAKFDEWKGALDQVDDICVMGVRV